MVTADGLLLWLDEELDWPDEEPLDDEPVEDEPVEDELFEDELFEDDVPVDDESSDEDVEGDDVLVDDGLLTVVALDDAVVVAPVEPVAAMTPKARTKVDSVAAAMRRRILLIRAARACSRCRTVSDVLGVWFEGMPAS